MNTLRPQALLDTLIRADLCTGCGACVDLCPYFVSFRGRTVIFDDCDREEGRCSVFCPRTAVDLDDISRKTTGDAYSASPLGSYREIYTSKAAVDGTYQAGGTVTALVRFLMDSGEIDTAVLTGSDGITPVAQVVTNADDVGSAAGSKYSAAPTLSALNRAEKDGFTKIGVVATPCQAMAAAKMKAANGLDRNPGDHIAFVIGLFCTWALDYEKLFEYLSERLDISKITGFDIPPPPAEVFEVFTDGGKETFPLSEIRPMVKNSCNECLDMTAEFADVSVGVLEGEPSFNTLIVRTERGEEAVKRAKEQGVLILDEMPPDAREHLMGAAMNKKRRALERIHERCGETEHEWGYIQAPKDIIDKIMG
jgi:coenzyme F420 hydrogenase subunit beta